MKLADDDMTMTTSYLFDEDSRLIAAFYRVFFLTDSIDEYTNLFNRLCAEVDSTSILRPTNTYTHEFTSETILGNIFYLQWKNDTDNTYFEINSSNFKETLVMGWRVSIVDLRN